MGTYGIKCNRVTEKVITDKIMSLTKEEAEIIYRARCADKNLNFNNVQAQYKKFINFINYNCINRKISLPEQSLSFNFAR